MPVKHSGTMFNFSDEQLDIINAPLSSMSVVACAGSGKTQTAVERLAKVIREPNCGRSHIALLSFSNVAVNTFRSYYSSNLIPTSKDINNNRVTIDTFDGFITSNVLRPHSYRTMGCKNTPFLLTGSEPFLLNKIYLFWYDLPDGGSRSVQPNDLDNVIIEFDNDELVFKYRFNQLKYTINNGIDVTTRMGKLGAYTHELGKYWVIKTLIEQPEVLRVLVYKYPHIIVDEAQDIGVLHQCIIQILCDRGSKVSLIGDPNQAIYEFAGANGQYLKNFDSDVNNKSYNLTRNYRSIPEVLNIANKISGRSDVAEKVKSKIEHGAYYVGYSPNNHKELAKSFINKLNQTGLSVDDSAILYRGNSGVEKLIPVSNSPGQGRIKLLTLATISRDLYSDYQKAFKLVVRCIAGLLNNTPDNFISKILNPGNDEDIQKMRRDIWSFVRSSEKGLPSAFLKAKTEWHGEVKKRIEALLDDLQNKYGYIKVDRLGNKLANTGLVDEPIISDPELALEKSVRIRVDTVHQAKGESLDGVLYVAEKKHIEAMLNGTNSELGRIGYVAVTRAKHLFILGVPNSAISSLESQLQAVGFSKL
jgi:superfamily I DNA/RNA helicase